VATTFADRLAAFEPDGGGTALLTAVLAALVVVFGLTRRASMQDSNVLSLPLNAVIRAVRELRRAVDVIVREPDGVVEAAFVAKKAATRIHRLYQADMATLLRQQVSTDLLKQRELLRRLESVSMHLNEAADVLSDASIKRG
jgi:hypothetical protein